MMKITEYLYNYALLKAFFILFFDKAKIACIYYY